LIHVLAQTKRTKLKIIEDGGKINYFFMRKTDGQWSVIDKWFPIEFFHC